MQDGLGVLTTERLVLRHWRRGDPGEAAALFRHACDPGIGPLCGWPPHRSVAESLAAIDTVLAGEENYAITLKGGDEPIGCIELKPLARETVDHVTAAVRDGLLLGGWNLDADDVRALTGGTAKELGYWLGRPFWGRGLMTEALRAMLRHAFADLDAPTVWGAHYVDNIGSAKVMEHAGLAPVCAASNHYALIDEWHDVLIRLVTRRQWSAV